MGRRRTDRGRGERGASLVEFALVAPLLFLLIFGIIEFGWGFSQYLDTRHGAREGARLAAVNYADPANPVPSKGAAQSGEIVAELCDRMGGNAMGARVVLGFASPGATSQGDRAFIEVKAELDTLTGFLDFALAGRDITDRISFRLERDVDWTATSPEGVPCP